MEIGTKAGYYLPRFMQLASTSFQNLTETILNIWYCLLISANRFHMYYQRLTISQCQYSIDNFEISLSCGYGSENLPFTLAIKTYYTIT